MKMYGYRIFINTSFTSNSLSVTDRTPPKKQVTVNNMVRNCIFATVVMLHDTCSKEQFISYLNLGN